MMISNFFREVSYQDAPSSNLHVNYFFVERDCTTLVRHRADEEQLRELTSVPFGDLRPEFQKGLDGLKSKLLGNIKVFFILRCFLQR